jgi:hypothetical protein
MEQAPSEINTSSSALLSLNPDDEIENAYLYWADQEMVT